jgi:hypothetical protein
MVSVTTMNAPTLFAVYGAAVFTAILVKFSRQ